MFGSFFKLYISETSLLLEVVIAYPFSLLYIYNVPLPANPNLFNHSLYLQVTCVYIKICEVLFQFTDPLFIYFYFDVKPIYGISNFSLFFTSRIII